MEKSLALCSKFGIELRRFPDLSTFVSFGDKFFDSSRDSCIHKLILDINGVKDDATYLTSWIDAAVKRKVQYLDVNYYVKCFGDQNFYEMPTSLLTCETLVFLKLEGVALPDSEFVSLLCLKTMHLVQILYPNEATFERLVSSCPVLDELEVIVASNDAGLYRMRSQSLKTLSFMRASRIRPEFVSGVVIDAPLLRVLCTFDNASTSFVVNNLESNAKLGLSLDFGFEGFHEASDFSLRRNRFRSFLPGISSVRHLTVNAKTFKLFHDYSKFQPLPQFSSLSHMHVTLCVSDLDWFLTFLESFPNLRLLILELDAYEGMRSEDMDRITFSSVVPECLLSSLEYVDFNTQILGYAAEMKLVKYFLENSEVLKKLTLHVNHGSRDSDIAKELLKIPRRSASATCEVSSSDW